MLTRSQNSTEPLPIDTPHVGKLHPCDYSDQYCTCTLCERRRKHIADFMAEEEAAISERKCDEAQIELASRELTVLSGPTLMQRIWGDPEYHARKMALRHGL